jgi:tetratricopeptide (TPR) repeat protein
MLAKCILLVGALLTVVPSDGAQPKGPVQTEASLAADRQDAAKMAEVDRLIDESMRLFDEHRYGEAADVCEQALAISERFLGEGPYTAMVLTGLGLNQASSGQYDKAEKTYMRALAIHERVYGHDSEQSAMLLTNIGLLYRNTGRPSKARPFLARASAIEAKAKTSP